MMMLSRPLKQKVGLLFFPLTVIQLNAIKIENQISSIFTNALGQMTLSSEKDEEKKLLIDHIGEKSKKATVALADESLEFIHTFSPTIEMKYNEVYNGLNLDGQPNNFATFSPQKDEIRLDLRIKKSEEIENQISEKGLNLMDYTRCGWYRICLSKSDLKEHSNFITQLLK